MATGTNGNDYLDDLIFNDNFIEGLGGNDTIYGWTGEDTLTGFGFGSGEYDILTGGSGTGNGDLFVLGDSFSAFYQGAGYATIKDFFWGEGDKFQVHGSINDYSLDTWNRGGSSAVDTEIYYKGDLIGVVQDTTNVILGVDFKFR